MSQHYQKASFLLSVAEITQLPPDNGIEVAIVGRSNAGKSSVLNCLTQSKNLARISKTPGRTQLLNVFKLDDQRRIVDLPGYGFAKVPLTEKEKWEKTINAYLGTRECLKGLLLIMDSRHPLKPMDWQILDYCRHRSLLIHIILNKIDKLTYQEQQLTLREVGKALTDYPHTISYQAFSAMKGTGLKELQKVLDQWYGY